MSALLMLFYWVVIPVGVFWLFRGMWRRARTDVQKGLVGLLGVFGFLGLFWLLGGGEQGRLDRQVRELCAKDGGVKVYEQVRLPAEAFDKWGMVKFYDPTKKEEALGTEYSLVTSVDYKRRGSPSLRRYHVQVFRKRDGKLLGESVGYDRGGGDLPGPWQPSSFSCPDQHGEIVIQRIFVLE